MYILDSPTEGMTRKIILMNTDPVDDMSQQSVLVTFESGVAVKVANVGGYMNVVAVAPPSFWVGHLGRVVQRECVHKVVYNDVGH